MTQRALILVDLQNDFMPGGALPVSDGFAVIPIANAVQKKFELIIATQDWHPVNHSSFAVWPTHCVQHSTGARLVADLDTSRITKIFPKGTDVEIDSYSGFFDNDHRKATGLGDYLKKQQVQEVYILGVATDYCVKYTALDACQLGFKTYLIVDGCRGVNLKPQDSDDAIMEMQRAGVKVVQSGELR